ncbi:MAG: rhodanese-like domain-containing protein [Holosporales bacterium]|jgi:rhodanese-related sulfurtransferase
MPHTQTLTPFEAKNLLDNGEAILIDVREPAEYKAEHIKGSHLMPLGVCCPEKLPTATKNKIIIIHCKAGKRGEKACAALRESGQTIYNLAGGLDAWMAAGLPIEKGRGVPLMRQVQIVVGGLVGFFTILGFAVHPGFHAAAGIIGLGLLNAGLTGWCGMAMLLAKMPWNR